MLDLKLFHLSSLIVPQRGLQERPESLILNSVIFFTQIRLFDDFQKAS